jgi:acyl-CoA synthetase (AMP-forming)/AMP-acid ligase II
LEAAQKAGIPKNRVYLFDLPKEILGGAVPPKEFKTVNQLIKEGSQLPELEPLNWKKGQGKTQVAFLCYSSGTSGLPVRIISIRSLGI